MLYLSSYALISRYRWRTGEDYLTTDEDEATVYRVSLYLCSVALAVSIGAALLLPVSIASNEILILYPNSYYVKWLNSSLVQGIVNFIILFYVYLKKKKIIIIFLFFIHRIMGTGIFVLQHVTLCLFAIFLSVH